MIPGSHSPDDELIVRAYYGDREAFGDLYERYLTRIYRYIYFRIANSDEAEDLTEVVFQKAWEALSGIRLEDFQFKAWIYRIAHNQVIDRYRTHRVEISLEQLNAVGDADQDPEAAQSTHEWIGELRNSVLSLEPIFQEVILYRFVLGYSHAETAEIMGKSVIYVRVLQHRALAKLKDRVMKETEANE
ncbi:MAG: sigma-70 family RNA polymerase sigma factor [Anaerolineaceae bacterium]|nr:sigma-70 family RNA polymerase sigma factor [Anaerolineaceae bacterium]